MRNRGSQALGRTGKTIPQIASEVGVGKSTVGRWVSGEKKPGVGARRDRCRELYGIEQAWWDEPIVRVTRRRADAPAPPVAPPARGAASPPADEASDATALGGAFGMARQLEQMAREEIQALREMREAEESTPLERARVMASIAATLNVLAKLTGEYDLGRKMTRTPMWARLEAELGAALRPWPDAARAVAERFAMLDAEAQRQAG